MRIIIIATIVMIGLTLNHVIADDLVKTRQAYFKENAEIMKSMRGLIRNNNFQEIANASQKISDWARKMPDFFPEGATSKGASPTIWKDFDDFLIKANDNHVAAMALYEAALSENKNEIATAVKILGASCKNCHQSYKAD